MGNRITTEILRFSRKENKWKKYRDCELLANFVFARNEYYLTLYKNFYFVCISDNGDLKSVWYLKAEGVNNGQCMSQFRNNYLKSNITADRIKEYLDNPIEYCDKYKIKKRGN